MEAILLDEQGLLLAEITSHLGRSGKMVVDRANQHGALFHYYFERGGRIVTMLKGTERFSAILETRWQMGARFWFLHTFVPLGMAPRVGRGRFRPELERVERGRSDRGADATHRPSATARASEPRGTPG